MRKKSHSGSFAQVLLYRLTLPDCIAHAQQAVTKGVCAYMCVCVKRGVIRGTESPLFLPTGGRHTQYLNASPIRIHTHSLSHIFMKGLW